MYNTKMYTKLLNTLWTPRLCVCVCGCMFQLHLCRGAERERERERVCVCVSTKHNYNVSTVSNHEPMAGRVKHWLLYAGVENAYLYDPWSAAGRKCRAYTLYAFTHIHLHTHTHKAVFDYNMNRMNFMFQKTEKLERYSFNQLHSGQWSLSCSP